MAKKNKDQVQENTKKKPNKSAKNYPDVFKQTMKDLSKKKSFWVVIAVVVVILIAVISNSINNSRKWAKLADECKASLHALEWNPSCGSSEYIGYDFYYTQEDIVAECKRQGRKWVGYSYSGTCLSEEESEKSDKKEAARKECSDKGYNWNYGEERCNTDSEQQAAIQEKAEEDSRREEANKTTTIAGKDHDENDNAGKFDAIMSACLDRLENNFPGTYPLDSDDGYPIYYSITVKGDGTLVKGSMTGYHRTRNGQKVLDYKCSYEDGSAKILGLD